MKTNKCFDREFVEKMLKVKLTEYQVITLTRQACSKCRVHCANRSYRYISETDRLIYPRGSISSIAMWIYLQNVMNYYKQESTINVLREK